MIFVRNSRYINILKLQQISLITKFIDTYNSSNSRYIKSAMSLIQVDTPALLTLSDPDHAECPPFVGFRAKETYYEVEEEEEEMEE